MADMIPMGKLLAAAKKEYPNLDKEELTALIGLQIEARQAEANALMKRSNKGGYKLGRAEGGNISNQMEMFEDGGLKDEGNTIDPISGNDVPPGSTQEEVRDDIPAQLSEGEFVFPADVVRYIGLEKLMMMRQEAKMGLKTMEDMGQMGNSEEATIPDDMPFDINDIDIDDEEEYNSEDMDMAQGGVVHAANGFAGTTTNTNQLGSRASSFGNTTTRVQPKPYTPPPPPVASVAPAGGYKYGAEDVEKKAKTSFSNLFKGAGLAGADEYRTYINDAGAEIQVPFKNSKMLTGFILPVGYRPKVDTTKTKSTKTKTIKKNPKFDNDGGESDDDLATLGGARTDIGGVQYAISYGLDGSVSIANVDDANRTGKAQFDQLTPEAAAAVKAQAIGQLAQIAKVAGIKNIVVDQIARKFGVELPGSKLIDKLNAAIDKAKVETTKLSQMKPGDIFDMGRADLDDTFKERSTKDERAGTEKGREGLTEKDLRSIQGGLQYGRGTQINKGLDDDFISNISKGVTKGIQDSAFTKQAVDYGDGSNRGEQGAASSSMGESAGGSSDPGGRGGDSKTGFGGGYGATYKGSFITRNQPSKKKQKTKVKKMKRGGLASRK